MKLKGTTIIELTDVKTGEKTVTEDKNFITNALRDLCQPILRNQDTLTTIYFKEERTCSVNSLMGGLLLFDTPLEENADNYFAPPTAKMVGHGGSAQYLGSDTALGSYNASQSSSDTNEITNVWDFTSEQANGVISSVCLTTKCGGVIGYGTEICPEENTTAHKSLSNIQRSILDAHFSSNIDHETKVPLYLNFKNDELVLCDFVNIQSGILNLDRIKLSSNSIDIFKSFPTIDSENGTYRFRNAVGGLYTESEESVILDLKPILGTGSYFGIAHDGRYLYLTSKSASSENSESGAWAPGTTITLLKYDLETFTYETYEVTNTTSAPLAIRTLYTNLSGFGYTFGVSDGYMFVREWVNKNGDEVAELYAINLSNNTDVKKVQNASGKTKIVGVINYVGASPFTMTIQGKVGFVKKAVAPSAGGYYNTLVIVSTSDFISRYLNAAAGSLYSNGDITNNSASNFPRVFPTDNPLYFGALNMTSSTTKIYTGRIHAYPYVLMTINNLSTPVEKTPAQTMRIIYKITKE